MKGLITEMSKLIISGTIGAGLALLVEHSEQAGRRKEDRTLATMTVATQLRSWMYRCAEIVADVDSALNSQGAIGQLHAGLPDLPYETSMEQVIRLGPADSERLFDLIYEKNSINAEVSFAREVDGPGPDYEDPGANSLCGRAGVVYVQSLDIYRDLAPAVGWKIEPFPDWQLDVMREEDARWQRVLRQRKEYEAPQVDALQVLDQA